jgi:hypothetical protein
MVFKDRVTKAQFEQMCKKAKGHRSRQLAWKVAAIIGLIGTLCCAGLAVLAITHCHHHHNTEAPE